MANPTKYAHFQPIETKTDFLLSRLDGVKNTGANKWLARCPAHNDKSPNLSIKQVDDRILVYCFAGCGCMDVLAAVGLDSSALFPEKVSVPGEKLKAPPRFNKSELFDLLIQEAGILALGWNDLLVNTSAPDTDRDRVQRAYSTVMELLCEVRR